MTKNQEVPWKTRRRNGFDRIFGACAGLVLLVWLAYAWERSTGLTFTTRSGQGALSSGGHLEQTRRTAVGITILCGPIAFAYFAFLRPKD